MLTKIICEMTLIQDTVFITSKQGLAWARQAEAQRIKIAILDNLREKGL